MNKLKNPKILIPFLIVIALLVGVYAYFASAKINMTLKGDQEITLEYGENYLEEGATALIEYPFGNTKEIEADIEGEVDENTIGEYILTYKAGTFFHNQKLTRKIIIEDTVAPEIELTEQGDHYTKIDTPYEEDGYKATDNYDGDLTEQVESIEENGIVTYTVKDSSGNETTVTRTIQYEDTVAPELTLKGEAAVSMYVGDSYSEPGYSATDDRDGDLSEKVSVEGSVDTATAGTYTLTYKVQDSFGNETTKTRTVTVSARPASTIRQNTTANDGNKIVYLTFDDGPGPYTQQLLDILAKYNVKATFFVTAQYPNYLSLIGKEAAAGHTVAIHTYSHNYATVYSSVDAYYADLNKMNDIIYQYTGSRSNLLRFPGGSSNAVSKSYCSGIMTTLVSSVQNNGYHYFDWNVSSGDAGSTTSTSQVAENVINGISKCNVSVVLQHDIKSYSVAAVEQIIVWGLNNGYTFLPLDASSYGAHHARLNN